MAAGESAIGPGEPAPKTIGLCMIVKDEAKVILRCLDSVLPLIDRVCIDDTGSTDGTQRLIRNFIAEKGLPGEVFEAPWQDFAHNRSLALARLRQTRDIDYALLIDADDWVEYAPGFDAPAFKAALDAGLYDAWLETGRARYTRPFLCSNRLDFSYRGVLHEFLVRPEGARQARADGLLIHSTREGARGAGPDKYRADAETLMRALAQETDPFMRTRYTFYLAQSWRDGGEPAKALIAYLDRAAQGGWDEEVFISLYNAGKLQQALGAPIEIVTATLQRASDLIPARAEALHAASRACRVAGRHQLGYEIAGRGLDLPEPAGGLFIEPWIYHYGLLDEYSINAYWAGHPREALAACERLLRGDALPPEDRARILKNAGFAHPRQAAEGPEPAATESQRFAI